MIKIPNSDKVKAVVMIGAAVGVVFVAWKITKAADVVAKEAVEVVTVKINPASSGNLIYSSLPQDGFVKKGGLDPLFKFLGL